MWTAVSQDVEDVGVVAFEVTEAVDPALARQLGDQQAMKTAFHEEYERLPAANRRDIQERLANAIVHVEFQEDASLTRRRRAIPALLRALCGVPVDAKGELSVSQDWGLPDCVTWISISRGSFSGPSFDTTRAVSIENQLVPRLRAKFEKSRRYATEAKRIELLVYY